MPDYLGRQLGNYQLIRLLGTGGFAEVYLGEHIYLKTEVAVKVLHTRLAEEELEHFLDEARTVARLHHPHIVRVLGFGVEQDIPFLVMDYAPNGTLRQRFQWGKQLAPAAIVPYLRQMAEALDYAHEQKLIHRDVKPENILLDRNNKVVLSDFGIAMVFHSSRSQTTQEVVGSVSYMAPEQILGKPRPASDQYALGVVAYEWLSGERPFTGTFSEVAARQLHMQPASLSERVPGLAPAIEEVVLTALAKDYHKRFPSVRAFVDAFEQAQADIQPVEPADPIYFAPTQPGRFSMPASPLTNEPPPKPALPQPITIPSPVPLPGTWASPPTATAPGAQPASSGGVQGQPQRQAAIATSVLTPPGAAPAAPVSVQPETPPKAGISRRALLMGGLGGLAGLAAIGSGITWFVASQQRAAPTPLNTPSASRTPSTGSALTTYHSSSSVYTLAWSPDSIHLVSLSNTRSIAVWEALTQKQVMSYPGPAAGTALNGLAWSPNGQYIVAADGQGLVRVFTLTSATPIYSFQSPQGRVLAVAWSPTSSRIASTAGKTVLIWDATTGAHPQTLSGHTDNVLSLSWSPNGAKIASGGADHTVRVWDAATGKYLFTCQAENVGSMSTVAWSPDSRLIAAGSLDQTVRTFDGNSGKESNVYEGFIGQVYAVGWSPTGSQLAWTGDNYVQVASANLQSTDFSYEGHTDTVYTLAWSPSGKYIASGGADKTVQVWVA